MAQTLAAEEEVDDTTPETLTEPEITIQVNSDFEFSVDETYISVPEDTSTVIRWRISAPDLPLGSTIRFDRPAITFFGEDANGLLTVHDSKHVSMTWLNDEDHRGRSFFYRIHMVGSRPGLDGTTQKFALSHDPTIHNDPPS